MKKIEFFKISLGIIIFGARYENCKRSRNYNF